jgi:hypothetical protein
MGGPTVLRAEARGRELAEQLAATGTRAVALEGLVRGLSDFQLVLDVFRASGVPIPALQAALAGLETGHALHVARGTLSALEQHREELLRRAEAGPPAVATDRATPGREVHRKQTFVAEVVPRRASRPMTGT